MAPSLEVLENAVESLPVKTVGTRINGVPAVSSLELDRADQHDKVLKVFRAFIADLCQQFGGGHPG